MTVGRQVIQSKVYCCLSSVAQGNEKKSFFASLKFATFEYERFSEESTAQSAVHTGQ